MGQGTGGQAGGSKTYLAHGIIFSHIFFDLRQAKQETPPLSRGPAPPPTRGRTPLAWLMSLDLLAVLPAWAPGGWQDPFSGPPLAPGALICEGVPSDHR